MASSAQEGEELYPASDRKNTVPDRRGRGQRLFYLPGAGKADLLFSQHAGPPLVLCEIPALRPVPGGLKAHGGTDLFVCDRRFRYPVACGHHDLRGYLRAAAQNHAAHLRYRAGCAPEHRRHAGKPQPSDREQFQRPADPDLPQSHVRGEVLQACCSAVRNTRAPRH